VLVTEAHALDAHSSLRAQPAPAGLSVAQVPVFSSQNKIRSNTNRFYP